jgi:hypothetical protein
MVKGMRYPCIVGWAFLSQSRAWANKRWFIGDGLKNSCLLLYGWKALFHQLWITNLVFNGIS